MIISLLNLEKCLMYEKKTIYNDNLFYGKYFIQVAHAKYVITRTNIEF